MLHKFNADRHDKIPKQKQRVTNWAEYNEGVSSSYWLHAAIGVTGLFYPAFSLHVMSSQML